MAKQRQAEFPGGHLACGQFHALLRPDQWTALQWMRFRFSKPDSAFDLLLREHPVPPGRADELAQFVATVHSQSSEPIFPLRYGRGAHLQRDVQALVSHAPKARGGPALLRDLVPLDEALSALGGLVRRAPEENQPVVATSAMTLLRTAWEGRRGDVADAELIDRLEESRPGVGEAAWRLAIAACVRLEEAAIVIVNRYGPAGLGARPEQALARRIPGFPDEVYRQAIGLGLEIAR